MQVVLGPSYTKHTRARQYASNHKAYSGVPVAKVCGPPRPATSATRRLGGTVDQSCTSPVYETSAAGATFLFGWITLIIIKHSLIQTSVFRISVLRRDHTFVFNQLLFNYF